MEREIETAQGTARAHLGVVDDARGALVLGHGAGGGVSAPDLRAAAEAARDAGFSVALVEQPYRVAGRRSPPQAPRLDEAWIEIVADLTAGELGGVPLVCGGRSSGARVACRTAADVGASGVLCLAFPLVPPARKSGHQGPSRLPELEVVSVPVLVVQGENDRFGMPPRGRARTVVPVPGDHSLRSAAEQVREAIGAWLPQIGELGS